MADVFVSYSRADQPFVRALHDALARLNKDIWVDWEDIPPTAEWLKEVYGGIESSDTFLFVISPDAMRSGVCRGEFDHALRHNKRIVPLLRRETEPAQIPQALAARNWIFFRDADDFDAASRTLAQALETDLEWVRAHTRLLTRALEWSRGSRDRSLLLRGADLHTAERWLALGAAGRSPAPTETQAEYISASRQAETRRQRYTLGAVTTGLILVAGLAIVALLQRQTAIEERDRAQSRQLAAQSSSRLSSNLELSLLLAVEAARIQPTAEAEVALREAVLAASQLVRGEELENVEWASTSAARQLSPDGRLELSGAGNVAVLREARTGRLVREMRGHSVDVESVRFSADGRLMQVEAEGGAILVWRVAIVPASTILQHPAPVTAAVVSPDGKQVLTVAAKLVRVWDLETARELARFAGSGGAFSADGSRIVTFAGNDAAIVDTRSLQPRLVLHGHTGTIRGAAFSREGSLVVTAGDDRTARVWDAATGILRFELKGHGGTVTGAAFSPDGAAIATSSADGTARIWDASSGRLSSELRGHASDVLSVAFSPDGARVLTASEDGTARIWDVTAGRQRAVLNQTNEGVRAAFSPGGQIVLTGSEDIYGAKVWDAGTGRLVSQLSRFTEIVSSVGFSPNGKWALTASHDGSVRVWDPATGALAIDLRDHTGPVYAASFGPDGKLVVTAGDDGRALVFRCDACGSIDDLLAMASRLVTRSLTAEERLEYLPDGGAAAR